MAARLLFELRAFMSENGGRRPKNSDALADLVLKRDKKFRVPILLGCVLWRGEVRGT